MRTTDRPPRLLVDLTLLAALVAVSALAGAAGCVLGEEQGSYWDEPSDDGVITPAPTCDADADCPPSCVVSAQCGVGFYCESNRTCQPSCTCEIDDEARAEGFDYCDTRRGTCERGLDPASCEAVGNERACVLRADCVPTYDGHGCTAPDGSPCATGTTCTCTDFAYAACDDAP